MENSKLIQAIKEAVAGRCVYIDAESNDYDIKRLKKSNVSDFIQTGNVIIRNDGDVVRFIKISDDDPAETESTLISNLNVYEAADGVRYGREAMICDGSILSVLFDDMGPEEILRSVKSVKK